MERQERPKAEWKTVKEIGEGDLRVRVQRRGDWKPQYSIQIGRKRDDEPERLSPFHQVRVDAQGSVKIDRTLEEQLPDMLKQAHDFVHEDASYFEDQRIQKMADKEERSINYGKKDTPHTGKTERNRNKKQGNRNDHDSSYG